MSWVGRRCSSSWQASWCSVGSEGGVANSLESISSAWEESMRRMYVGKELSKGEGAEEGGEWTVAREW